MHRAVGDLALTLQSSEQLGQGRYRLVGGDDGSRFEKVCEVFPNVSCGLVGLEGLAVSLR